MGHTKFDYDHSVSLTQMIKIEHSRTVSKTNLHNTHNFSDMMRCGKPRCISSDMCVIKLHWSKLVHSEFDKV